MAARVLLLPPLLLLLLLVIATTSLFTEVVPGAAAAAGARPSSTSSSGNGGNGGSGSNGVPFVSLEIRPRGSELVLARKGLTLTCSGAGPNAEIQWIRNGESAPPCGPARCKILENGSLRLFKRKNSIVQKRKGREENITLSSSSSSSSSKSNSIIGNSLKSSHIREERNEYRCIARTSYGASLRSAPTNILYAELSHAFRESPEDSTVLEGQVSRLSCSIDSVPSPANITWIHNGETISDSDTKYFILPGVLYINATKLPHAGSYRCLADNAFINATKKSKEAKLTVIPRHENEKKLHSSFSLFPQASHSYSLRHGSNLRLACAASGYPTPMTSWSFIPQTDDFVTVRREVPLNTSFGLTILDLRNLNASDTGTYLCSMKDTARKTIETQNVTLQVLIPPTLIKKPTNQVCPNGRTARFECQAQGFPTPRIYWLSNSTDIPIGGRRSRYDKESNKVELAISATVPSDSGMYQCVAVNAAGEVWAAGRLQVNSSRHSPAAPTSLKCEARSPVRMFVSWEPPKFLPFTNITAYTVHYKPVDGGKEEVSPPEPGNSTSVEVTKLLEPFTNYTFYVRLWNNHGASDQSSIITCTTHESVPKTAPKISVNVISSSKLNITWKPLEKKEAQGIVTEYKLEWRLFQHPSFWVRNLPANVESYILSDLTPGERYDVRVLARTKQGWPTVSESQLGWSSVTMPSSNDFTQAEISIFNSTALKVKWDVKTNSIIQFTSWKLFCKTQDETTVISVNLTKNSTEYVFTNLEPDLSYSIELCALNLLEKVHCITKRADLKKIFTSDAPTALEAIPLSSSSISLTWLSGKLNETNSFEVCYRPVLEMNDSSVCGIVNTTKIIITNLKPFMLYQFKVRTLYNETYGSPYSELIECYTKEDIPGRVQDIEWFLINSTKVMVAWKEPNNINGVIQSYYVAYSTDKHGPKSTWNNITVFGNRTSTNLPDLIPGKRYFVIVQAATKAGFGSPSEPIIIVTEGNSVETSSSLDEHESLPKVGDDRKLGVILGIVISTCCIALCLCSMYCRRKYESLRSLRESAQPFKSRVIVRNGNGCCIDRSSTSVNPPMPTTNELELAVLCPYTPTSDNQSCDAKGIHANGVLESGAKEPLLTHWGMNGIKKDVHITENPEYKTRECDTFESSMKQLHQDMSDMNSTQLTTINCDLSVSNESLNNNLGCCTVADQGNELMSQKSVPPIVPILEPNG